jgi:hypothetical protein
LSDRRRSEPRIQTQLEAGGIDYGSRLVRFANARLDENCNQVIRKLRGGYPMVCSAFECEEQSYVQTTKHGENTEALEQRSNSDGSVRYGLKSCREIRFHGREYLKACSEPSDKTGSLRCQCISTLAELE